MFRSVFRNPFSSPFKAITQAGAAGGAAAVVVSDFKNGIYYVEGIGSVAYTDLWQTRADYGELPSVTPGEGIVSGDFKALALTPDVFEILKNGFIVQMEFTNDGSSNETEWAIGLDVINDATYSDNWGFSQTRAPSQSQSPQNTGVHLYGYNNNNTRLSNWVDGPNVAYGYISPSVMKGYLNSQPAFVLNDVDANTDRNMIGFTIFSDPPGKTLFHKVQFFPLTDEGFFAF